MCGLRSAGGPRFVSLPTKGSPVRGGACRQTGGSGRSRLRWQRCRAGTRQTAHRPAIGGTSVPQVVGGRSYAGRAPRVDDTAEVLRLTAPPQGGVPSARGHWRPQGRQRRPTQDACEGMSEAENGRRFGLFEHGTVHADRGRLPRSTGLDPRSAQVTCSPRVGHGPTPADIALPGARGLGIAALVRRPRGFDDEASEVRARRPVRVNTPCRFYWRSPR